MNSYTFKLKNKTFLYNFKLNQPVGKEWSERIVETPLAFHFLNMFDHKSIIEIGAFTPYFLDEVNHKVYDVDDAHPVCDRTDLTEVECSFKNKNLLIISTLEHIGFGDYNQQKQLDKSINFLNKVVNEADNYLITWGCGYNTYLDNYVENEFKNYIFMRRISVTDWFVDDKNKSLSSVRYGTPYRCANGLVIISNLDL